MSLPLLAVGLVFWKAAHVRRAAAAEVRAESRFPFRVIPLDRAVPAGVEPIAASPDFRDIAAFQETIAASARAGLYLYDRRGAFVRAYRAGMELPAAELGAMSAGIAAGAPGPELFIATRGAGVLAFDGERFRQMLPSDADLRIVTALLVLGSGRLLAGTERQGLLVFDGRRLAPFDARLRHAHITALAGNDGDIWIGTLSEGLFHYRAGQLEELLPALPDPQVLAIDDEGDAVYAGTPLGVVEFRDGKRVRRLADGFFARALVRRGKSLYAGTQDEGILDVPLESRSAPRMAPDSSGPPGPTYRLANIEGDVYAVGATVVDRRDQSWRPVLLAPGAPLADRNVAALALSGGRLWIGYFDRGLDVMDAGLEHAAHFEDDTLFCINRIVTGQKNARTAVATANGLVLFDAGGRERQILGRKDGLLSDHITDVAFGEGGMAVATPAGLSFVDRSGVRSLYAFHGLVNNHVYTLATRGHETLAGTLGGLSVLDGDTVRANYTTANSSLKHNWITALAQVGDEWFAGTYGAGVLRLDSAGEWHVFPDLPKDLVVNPNAMAVTGGRVYAGSLDRGLFVFDRAAGRWTSTTAGLPSGNVTALVSGGGYLYVGTDNGLVRIAEGALE
ncbi:MAG TPA: hypothetical protein VMT86_05295 [Bryobacteraceae bacterium]|nr:hypothetical protein [Bryobacteraceae bacterium]